MKGKIKCYRNINRDILDIKELQWLQEGKQGVDHPLGAYDDNHGEDNELCYPCTLLNVFSRDMIIQMGICENCSAITIG